MTAILKCKCVHDWQDKKYGAGNRVHNRIDKPMKHNNNDWRCTVCKTERT